jgi:hypothetical protein
MCTARTAGGAPVAPVSGGGRAPRRPSPKRAKGTIRSPEPSRAAGCGAGAVRVREQPYPGGTGQGSPTDPPKSLRPFNMDAGDVRRVRSGQSVNAGIHDARRRAAKPPTRPGSTPPERSWCPEWRVPCGSGCTDRREQSSLRNPFPDGTRHIALSPPRAAADAGPAALRVAFSGTPSAHRADHRVAVRPQGRARRRGAGIRVVGAGAAHRRRLRRVPQVPGAKHAAHLSHHRGHQPVPRLPGGAARALAALRGGGAAGRTGGAAGTAGAARRPAVERGGGSGSQHGRYHAVAGRDHLADRGTSRPRIGAC